MCSCERGYQLDANEFNCTDIDECNDTVTNDCEEKCINMPGNYSCLCFVGYISEDDFQDCNGRYMYILSSTVTLFSL